MIPPAGAAWLPLPDSFYLPSAREVARRLLGHWLVRNGPDGFSGGAIVETEAYLSDDPACHAFCGETARNRVMWGPPGAAYVYFIYGVHFCFNAVCRPAGRAEAVLIRAISCDFGIAQMQRNRPVPTLRDLTSGPGKLCQALQITDLFNGARLFHSDSPVFIAANPNRAALIRREGPINASPRIGLSKAAALPLRFFLSSHPFVSGFKKSGSLRRVHGRDKRLVRTPSFS